MAEILSTGPDKPPRRTPPWLLPAVALALVIGWVTYALIGWAPLGRTHRSAVPTRSSATPSPSPGWTTFTPPTTPTLSAAVGPPPAGLRLFLPGAHPAVLDVASGASVPLAGLPAAGNLTTAFRLGSALVVLAGASTTPHQGVYVVSEGRSTRRIAEADELFPGRDGTLLTVSYGSPTPPTTERLSSLDLTGRVQWSWLVPYPDYVVADTSAGLLLSHRSDSTVDGTRDLRLVDPRTGALRRTIATAVEAVTADDHRVAWVPPRCTTDCRLYVADLEGAGNRVFRLAADRPPGQGLFSPDGRRLALSWYGTHPELGAYRPGYAAVLDLDTGVLRRIPGISTPTKHSPDLGWTADGTTLLLGVHWPDHWRLAYWPPGGELRMWSRVIRDDGGTAMTPV